MKYLKKNNNNGVPLCVICLEQKTQLTHYHMIVSNIDLLMHLKKEFY